MGGDEDILMIDFALADVEVAHCIRLDWVNYMHSISQVREDAIHPQPVVSCSLEAKDYSAGVATDTLAHGRQETYGS